MVSSPSRAHLHLPLLTPHAVPSYSRVHEVKRLQAVRRYDVSKGSTSLGQNNCCNTTFGIVTP